MLTIATGLYHVTKWFLRYNYHTINTIAIHLSCTLIVMIYKGTLCAIVAHRFLKSTGLNFMIADSTCLYCTCISL